MTNTTTVIAAGQPNRSRLTNIQTQKVDVQPQLALPTHIELEQKATNGVVPIEERVLSSLGGICPLLLDKMEGVKGEPQHFFLFKTKYSDLVFDECFTPSTIKGSTGTGGHLHQQIEIKGGSV